MGLKLELDSLDGVDESVKGLYTEKDGKFRLDVEGVEDTSGLKKKLDELMTEAKEAKRKAKEAEEKAAKEAEERAKKNGDVEALTKSWEEKFNKLSGERTQIEEQYKSMINGLTVDSTATTIAAQLAVPGSAEVLLPHIRSRLTVEISEGKPVVKVLDEQGKPSALTVDELKNEISSKPAFAPLISASKASGAGHQGNGGGGASKAFNEYTGAELSKIRQENPAEYARLVKEKNES